MYVVILYSYITLHTKVLYKTVVLFCKTTVVIANEIRLTYRTVEYCNQQLIGCSSRWVWPFGVVSLFRLQSERSIAAWQH